MINENIMNKELRERFHHYRKTELLPSLKEIAKVLGCNYNAFTEWNKGTKIFGDKNLVKIDTFLKSKGY
ncbi:hypothetical protein HED42_06990 [Enterococcus casseliflavus]|uniref:hypothetical protein n=1 Tax=Enterococcus casseliflavus TaxID=37734 RepID=UPI00143346B6|nr:hypothetical protein [Enterococcus casseliflavus]NKD37876.1 hypothetical protein [Enterococcus casseliflavus]